MLSDSGSGKENSQSAGGSGDWHSLRKAVRCYLVKAKTCKYAQPLAWILFCFLTKRVDNFISTFRNTNETCFSFVLSRYFPPELFSLW